MRKKWILFLMFFAKALFADAAFAGAGAFDNPISAGGKDESALLEKIKKENADFRHKLLVLLEEHSRAQSAEKERKHSQIEALILSQAESGIENNKKFISIQLKRLKEIEDRGVEIGKNKKKYAKQKADYFIERYKKGDSANPL